MSHSSILINKKGCFLLGFCTVVVFFVIYILSNNRQQTVNGVDDLEYDANFEHSVDVGLSRPKEIESLKQALNEQARENKFVKMFLENNNVPKLANKQYPKVKHRKIETRKRIVVTGGAGFLGSHLVDRLMTDGHQVVCLDNFFTGDKANIQHWIGHPNFELVTHDIVNPIYLEADVIYHLASPASPPHYMFNPVKTIKTNSIGTINMLGIARRTKAKILLASTSEVYGDPFQHPQSEDYWGNVNPIGPRACYDEGKRIAEALMVAYQHQEKVDIRIARIFNTYGPRMSMNDGRIVSNFIVQALQNSSITIYGDGSHTRSFQYVSDLIDGFVALMESNVTVPVNFGNTEEMTIEKFAQVVKTLTNSNCSIVYGPAPTDDPKKRRPDISRAWNLLKWKPRVSLNEGLAKTIEYFKQQLALNEI